MCARLVADLFVPFLARVGDGRTDALAWLSSLGFQEAFPFGGMHFDLGRPCCKHWCGSGVRIVPTLVGAPGSIGSCWCAGGIVLSPRENEADFEVRVAPWAPTTTVSLRYFWKGFRLESGSC